MFLGALLFCASCSQDFRRWLKRWDGATLDTGTVLTPKQTQAVITALRFITTYYGAIQPYANLLETLEASTKDETVKPFPRLPLSRGRAPGYMEVTDNDKE